MTQSDNKGTLFYDLKSMGRKMIWISISQRSSLVGRKSIRIYQGLSVATLDAKFQTKGMRSLAWHKVLLGAAGNISIVLMCILIEGR